MEQKEQHIVWHDDVVMKQFISYAVGCMMGRYRLDKKGLHIAHPNPTAERKKLDSIRKQIDECREYHDRLHVVADEQIAFDLDDGVVVNYAKFGDVLAKLK